MPVDLNLATDCDKGQGCCLEAMLCWQWLIIYQNDHEQVMHVHQRHVNISQTAQFTAYAASVSA